MERYNVINQVLTLSEASKLWGKDISTLRRVIQNNKFTEGIDYRKSEKTILITRESMERVYGALKDNMESKMIEIRNKVIDRVNHKDIDDAGDIIREEYFYCVGRSLAILQKYTIYKENINKFLNTNSVEVLKDYKRALLKKYMQNFLNFTESYSPEWNVVTVTYCYEPDSYTEKDKEILMYGYLDTSKLNKGDL